MTALHGILFAFLTSPAPAQFAADFSLSKPTYLAGEPVFLDLKVKNVSGEPLVLEIADPLTICSGYRFVLPGARDREAKNCGAGGGSCLGGFVSLAPGKSTAGRILVNTRYDLRQPGRYELKVSYWTSHAPADHSLPVAALLSHQSFEKQVDIVLEPSRPEQLQSIFAPYLHELDSPDWRKRSEAANVISLLAPPFLESRILHMLRTTGMQGVGVEGARNLGTPSAHRALAEYLKNSPPLKYPALYQMALRYLGEIGDSGDLPILLEAAHKSPDRETRRTAMTAAGEAGGAAAVSAIETELHDPSRETRDDAQDALSFTGSRSAVPVLIELLRSPEERISSFAEYGLEQLTHLRGATMDGQHPPPRETYLKWIRWWMMDGQTANIFKRDQCGETKPIPFF